MAQWHNSVAQDLDALLTLLTRHGVSSCKLSESGTPLELTFWAPGLAGLLGDQTSTPEGAGAQTPLDAAAKRLATRGLNGANGSGN